MRSEIPIRLSCVVEGEGEVASVPALLHRICLAKGTAPIHVARMIRWGRQKLLKAGEAERATQLAVKYAGRDGGVIVLIDADDDCAATTAPSLLKRAQSAAGEIPVSVTFACREFESWFLAAAECFQGFRGLPGTLVAPDNSEEKRGAKDWLRQQAIGRSYRPTVDQVLFTKKLDLELARRSTSYRRFEREVVRLVETLASRQGRDVR